MTGPVRVIKNLFVDFLIWSSGTWVGSCSGDDPSNRHKDDNDKQDSKQNKQQQDGE